MIGPGLTQWALSQIRPWPIIVHAEVATNVVPAIVHANMDQWGSWHGSVGMEEIMCCDDVDQSEGNTWHLKWQKTM